MLKKEGTNNSNNNQDKRVSRKAVNRFSFVSILIIISILGIGLIWQFLLDNNSSYREVEIKIGYIHSDEGYDDILIEKLQLDREIEITPIKESEVSSTNLEKFSIIIILESYNFRISKILKEIF